MPAPRYLVPFDPKRVPHRFADVLIIGGGVAGLRAALAIPEALSVVVVTKGTLNLSNSAWAQGGIAGVLDPEDRFDNHIEDTLTAGADLCDRPVVEMVVREAPKRIRELIDWGTHFDEHLGTLDLGREGGHSHHRIVHALGDATGKEMMRAIIERASKQPNLEFWENAFTLDLLTDETTLFDNDGNVAGSGDSPRLRRGSEAPADVSAWREPPAEPGAVKDGATPWQWNENQPTCRGAIVWNAQHGKTFVWAKQTILCTGGAGQLYRETTNPDVATGDGLAAAYRAGAEVRDMEFMQFHPTVLYIAGSSRSLITEAMRGEGAYLVDRGGYRFMADYDPRLELAPRDVVSRAIVTQMEKTRHPNVYLDLSHLPATLVLERFPGIAKVCADFGIDITKDPIPVRPGAHYMIGGVTVDLEGRTTVKNLWAAGEVTSSGLHGANRLASNSLLEGLVYGAHAGEGAAHAATTMEDNFRAGDLENEKVSMPGELLDLADIRNSLQSLMWRNAGVRRDREGLIEARDSIERWSRYVLARQLNTVEGWELQNLLTVAGLVIRAALEREETRGVHLRTDFPQRDNEHWRRRLVYRRG